MAQHRLVFPGPAGAANVSATIQPRPIRQVFLSAHQEEMRAALGGGEGLLKVLDLVQDANENADASHDVSRIARAKPWRHDGLFLLAQLETDVLKMVLDMTLPQRAAQQHGRRPNIRQPARVFPSANDMDAVIYIQSIADRDGCGLTLAEFEDFLEAMEVGANLKTDSTGRFNRQGSALLDGINRIYSSISAARSRFHSSTATTFEEKVEEFVRVNRDILTAARVAGHNHIMLKFEVGWSIRGYHRCHKHRQLGRDSPDHLRLALLVLQHLHPTRGFRYHQFVLFDILTDKQAAIGEALATELCCSATLHGGFNVATAGISVNGAEHDTTPKQWRVYSSLMVQLGRLSNVDDNMESVRMFHRRELNEQNSHLANVKMQDEHKTATKLRDRLHRELLAENDRANTLLDGVTGKMKSLNEELDRVEQEDRDLDEARAAIRVLGISLGSFGAHHS